MTDLQPILKKYPGATRDALIPILQEVQEAQGYLSRDCVIAIGQHLGLPASKVYGVATFYNQFRFQPLGRYNIQVCRGTACHVKGSEAVFNSVRKQLGIEEGDTDSDGLFTVQKVACLGCCTLAPAVQIDETTYGHVRTDTVSDMITDFLANEANRVPRTRKEQNDGEAVGEVRIGLGSCCVAGGSAKIRDALEESLETLKCRVDVKPVGCVGMCHQTPLVEVLIRRPDEQKQQITAKTAFYIPKSRPMKPERLSGGIFVPKDYYGVLKAL